MSVEEFDLLIQNGTLVDGTGGPARVADVAIRGGRIARIGDLKRTRAPKMIDASGQIVAPGFIDLHTHYDAQIHWDPYCTISGWHGITTVAMGNCGFGFAPVSPDNRDRAMQMMTRNEAISYEAMQEGMTWDWVTFPEWLDVLDRRLPKGVNCAMLAPMSPILTWVMGLKESKSRRPTETELRQMQQLLMEAMDAGACGWSTQRLGRNSMQGDYDGTPMGTDLMVSEDVVAMARTLAKCDSGFIELTYVDDITSNAEETATSSRRVYEELAEVSGRNILYNVIAVDPLEPDAHQSVLEWIHGCQARGLKIFGQGLTVRTMPTITLEHWNLWDYVPAWKEATLGTAEEKKRKLADPSRREALVASEAEIAGVVGMTGPVADLKISGCGTNPELQKYVGLTVGEVARQQDKTAVDVLLDLSIEGDLKVEFHRPVSGLNHNAEAAAEVVRSPYCLPGISDGGAHTKFFTGSSYPTDTLAWLVRDTGKLSLEDAHYHLSGLPAQVAGFAGRGILAPGAAADVVVYDLDGLKLVPEWGYDVEFDQPAGEWRRVQRAEGYRWTIVNGVATFEDGKCTGATPGNLLRHGR